MRVALFLLSLVALTLAGYLVIGGWFLALSAADVLRVGASATAQRESVPQTDPLTIGYRGNPMQALNLPFTIKPIQTPLGPAEAWLVPATGAETGRAIFVHGIAGLREDGYRQLVTLHEAGWSVLLIGYRNDLQAPSAPGNYYGMGLLEWPDLEAAVAAFSPGPDGLDILISADSMGSAILGQFLAQSDLADRVGSVVLDSPALSFSAVVDHLANQGGGPLPAGRAWVALHLLPRLTGLPLDEAEVANAFVTFPGPLFIAQGSDDRTTPIGPSQAMAAARTGSTATLWTKAGHLMSYSEDPGAYRAAFGKFLSGLGS
ncbi:MAG: alpha/beta hydrolase [Rhodobacterales bacterium]|nr:alpha/beta hydrolase [Rhodobacterales bacterium]